jgi:hypothetical protein
VAARLSALAEGDQILMTKTTADLLASSCDYGTLGSIVGVPGAVAVVPALHGACDLDTFRALIWGGSAALIAAAIADAWSRMGGCRPRSGPAGARCAM